MENALVRVESTAGQPAAPLAQTTQAAREYVRQAKAANTARAYRADWTHFAAWCEAHSLPALPAAPGTVALYLAALAQEGRKTATIQRRLAAISKAHQAAGHDSPAAMKHVAVAEVWKGIRRAEGTAHAAKAPILTDDLRSMLGALPLSLLGIRDRALLLVGFAGAFRRSELVSLNREDVEFTPEGVVVTLRRSKVDQHGEGRKIGLPYGSNSESCPVRALQAWLEASGIVEGPVFRHVDRHGRTRGRLSGYAVALVVKRRVVAAGLDPAKYAGHSLRAGLATQAAFSGASERSIMAQTGHRSTAMVRRYIRDGSLFRDNAAARVGL